VAQKISKIQHAASYEEAAMARLEGKVAFITGAARGQGRAHAVRMAAEGADIIAVDACAKLPASTAPVATVADLEETAALVRAHQRRIVTVQVDTRDEDALTKAVASGVEQLGRLDIAVANAGIGGVFSPASDYDAEAFRAVLDIDLTGAFLTAKVAIPHIRAHGQGGSIRPGQLGPGAARDR
jgi:(+)-trans-carveol dehydrogenase